MLLISPNFAVKSIIFPQFWLRGLFPKLLEKALHFVVSLSKTHTISSAYYWFNPGRWEFFLTWLKNCLHRLKAWISKIYFYQKVELRNRECYMYVPFWEVLLIFKLERDYMIFSPKLGQWKSLNQQTFWRLLILRENFLWFIYMYQPTIFPTLYIIYIYI